MMSHEPYKIKYRDRSYRKYSISISKLKQTGSNYICNAKIKHESNISCSLKITFSDQLITSLSYDQINTFEDHLWKGKCLEYIIRDYIFNRNIEDIDNSSIDFTTRSEYSKRVFRDENGTLIYHRIPEIIAGENIFARKLVLRELYFINSSKGPVDLNYLIRNCHYYPETLKQAVRTMKTKGFIEEENKLLRLTYDGSYFVEEQLLSPYVDKCFLIAACRDEIYWMYNKIYKPAFNELGYDLVFQEQTEPKKTITEDIWENIKYCKIILCDLTYKRPNCFIEYGYALALNKPILLCVEESEGRLKSGELKVPFDTLTQKYSFWNKNWIGDSEKYREQIDLFKKGIMDRIKKKLSIIELESRL